MKFSVVLIFLLLSVICKSQQIDIGLLTPQDTAIFNQIEKESDPQRIHQLVIELILLSDDKSAIPLLEEAKLMFDISRKKKDVFSESVAMSFYGQGYRITGNFTKALQYHFKAIELSKQQPDPSLTAFAINQSAHIYKDREENEKAVSAYRMAIDYASRGETEIFKFYPVMNLGFVYLNADMPDSALYFSSSAVQMLDHIMSKANTQTRVIIERSLYVYCLGNLAGSYSKLNDKAKADYYYAIADEIVKRYKGSKTRYFEFFYFNLARHYQRYNLSDSSLYAARKAIETVLGTHFEYLSAGPAKILSDYYETRNADSTMKYLKIYLKGNEVMNSIRVTQQLQMMSFEEEQKNLEIQRMEKAYRERIVVYLLVGGLAVMLFIAFYMNRTNRQRKRINAELQTQKDQAEKTLAELRSTQIQLIHSEKMASLGELTAGIAHEIQNPLNFVNNFSEVNKELIDELEQEVGKGNLEEVKAIAKDIKENEQKINHHGKRADAIVKGMLQHSRTSSGVKEPTDINALADEYLRLAYHGLRAKDKSFNATTRTDFDPGIGNINVIPQEIGRVILNLITNAFYAVDERNRERSTGYEPTVEVITRRLGDKVEIRVKDNGIGIPKKVIDKIFQPFFTTKPTGQGTGLGLSLSYDIVKAHGGQLKVETKEGGGSDFIISLPSK